jgi:hypothetical protein
VEFLRENPSPQYMLFRIFININMNVDVCCGVRRCKTWICFRSQCPFGCPSPSQRAFVDNWWKPDSQKFFQSKPRRCLGYIRPDRSESCRIWDCCQFIGPHPFRLHYAFTATIMVRFTVMHYCRISTKWSLVKATLVADLFSMLASLCPGRRLMLVSSFLRRSSTSSITLLY